MRFISTTVNNTIVKSNIIKIWDALAKPGQKVKLETRRENIITWYACGPTVYDAAHIGHASSYIRLDMIRRVLESQNYKVLQIMGITDIDDKIINKANELGVGWESISHKYEAEFIQELRDLNIQPPLVRARVTNFIPQIVSFIENLISAGYAYPASDGSVYFDIVAFGQSGLFCSIDEPEEFTRPDLVDAVKLKRNKKDFALWKGAKSMEPSWPSPWSSNGGRPGWHIECSVMATHYFGPVPLDIHSGGCDLTFPHHQSEETQCCARFGLKKWVTHWIHTGHLIFGERTTENGVKMSKSLGNTLTIQDFLKENSPNLLRMFCLNYNTRSHLYYNAVSLARAKTTLRRFESFLIECDAILQGIKTVTCNESEELLWEQLPVVQAQVESALCDDFDTPLAITCIDSFIHSFYRTYQFNSFVESSTNSNTGKVCHSSIDFQLVLSCKSFVNEFLTLLGFNLEYRRADKSGSQIFEPLINDFVEFRQRVRCYSLALDEVDKQQRRQKIQERQSLIEACDQIREKLGHHGIEMKDYGKTTSWAIKES